MQRVDRTPKVRRVCGVMELLKRAEQVHLGL